MRMTLASGALGVKECLNFMGVPVGVTRRPLILGDTLSWEDREEFRIELERLGLIEEEKIAFEFEDKRSERNFTAVGLTPKIIKDFKLKVGEALVGSERELAHIDLVIGVRDGPVGKTYVELLSRVKAEKEA
ncbi:MAG: hypothetical protein GTN80_01245, partial [Nitrososphaeria archaeon]|nr:hypothetical protein [Nitrososphaeria archaeon]